ncbi:hypothetical protein [Streptomyces sp. MMBL 11-3]|uniref:hypothetical protein n=1 Tax=Streptomyces sp. MMBL 11-3 TaxID=3382639 RepID=UPI0039B64909
MRTFTRCLVTAVAAGCLAMAAGPSATAAAAPPAGASAPPAAGPLPEACAVDWTNLTGLADSGALQEAIIACVTAYTEREQDAWLQEQQADETEEAVGTEGMVETEEAVGTDATEEAWTGAEDILTRMEEALTGMEDIWTGMEAGDWDIALPAHRDRTP